MTTITHASGSDRVRIEGRFPSEGPARLYRGCTEAGHPVLVSVVTPDLAKRALLAAGLQPLSFGTLTSGEVYLAYDLPCGETLAERVDLGPLRWAEAARVFLPAVESLARFHVRGRVYAHLSPDAIVFQPDGTLGLIGRELRKLSSAFDRRGDTQVEMEELPFLAPECARGEPATIASDVFSIGAILFGAIAGFRAFDGRGFLELVHAVQTAEVPDLRGCLPGIPRVLSDIVASALRKDPDRRPTAEDFAEALRLTIRRTRTTDLPWIEEPQPPAATSETTAILSDGPAEPESEDEQRFRDANASILCAFFADTEVDEPRPVRRRTTSGLPASVCPVS